MALTKTKKKKRRPDHFRSKAYSTRKIQQEDFSSEQVAAFKELLVFDENIYLEHQQELVVGFDEVGRGSIAGPVCTGGFSCSTFYQSPQELLHEIQVARQVISDQLLSTNDRDSYYAETLINDVSVADDLEQLSLLSSLLNLEDSKKVSKTKREKLAEALTQVPCIDSNSHLFYDINFEAAKTVDAIGIVPSIWLSMTKNLIKIIDQYYEANFQIPQEITLLVDGPKSIAGIVESITKLKPEYKEIKLTQIAIKKGDSKSSLIAAASNLAKLKRDQYMEELAARTKNDYGWSTNVGYGTKRHYEAIKNYGTHKEHRRTYLANS